MGKNSKRNKKGVQRMSSVTLVIPTYNRSEPLKGTLDSILKTDNEPDQIMVVDDSSGDKSKKVCEAHELEVEYIRPENSINLPHARNVAIENSETEIIAFVDDDVKFADGWCEAIKTSFEDQNVGAVGGPTFEYNGDELKNPLIESDKNQNIITEEGFIQDCSTYWKPSKPVETDTLRGANMAFRRSVLEEINGFDEEYKGNSYREDTDICVRVSKAGYKLIYNPEAELEHLYIDEGGCRDKSRDFWYTLGLNHRRYVEKNFSKYRMAHLESFLFSWSYGPYSLLKIVLSSVKNKNPDRLSYLKGLYRGGA